ncbi:hypothetical protein [Streptomyces fructofermentans]|uniref:Uncharacterized protein n=1 Tax=Streptomyces fructofermentans TaxID=152141 RepID=A0A918NQC1_9ACTN|nr:hypothetical protein [Streptomyces fructofermentans]GGX86902.1 hypothetical protein GCM10010515_62850 [Streptomyces fructofermentans]
MTERGGRLGFAVQAVLFVAVLAALAGLFLFGAATVKSLVRGVVPTLLDRPGGPWTVGAGLGLVTVLGGFGGRWLSGGLSGERSGGGRLRGPLRSAASGACWAVACGAALFVLFALPGKNCSGRSFCAYIPGTGTVLLAYALTAGAVGRLLHRWTRARDEERRARHRERMRKLRRRGKGRSRAAREG